jgi:N-acetylglucosamine-6-sulfatase
MPRRLASTLLAPLLAALVLVPLAGCSDTPAASSGGSAADAAVDSSADASPVRPRRANVIFVLTDDLAWNLVPFMPHVVDLQRRGMSFTRYFVTDSLCCPSRSSIFTGKFPHDTGVFTNTAPDGGYAKYEAAGNPHATFATLLSAAGYRTSMSGKFLNGYLPRQHGADPGWQHWAVAGDGYPELDYDLNLDGAVVHHGTADSDYLTDVLAGLGSQFVQGGSGPFLLEIATFAPHAPYTPAARDLGTFHEQVPRTPAFATQNTNPPRWLAGRPPLTSVQIRNLDGSFNLRVEAVQSVDDLIGALEDTLVATGHDRDTYIVFSSDNGYHMGDHGLLAGKQTAFDTDIRVPLIVVGPGVPAGASSDAIVENIDLCPTFAEIAGQDPPAGADGHSLLALWHGEQPDDWRDFALVEHRGPELAPMLAEDPDNEARVGQNPDSYEAIRTASSLYVEYLSGETEFYDLTTDPWEMTNTAGTLAPARAGKLHDALIAAKNCHGASACWQAQKLAH